MASSVTDEIISDEANPTKLLESVVTGGLDHISGNNPRCPGCDMEENTKFQATLCKCLNAAIQTSSKNATKVTIKIKAQSDTGQLISDITRCDEEEVVLPLLRFSTEEIRNMKDIIISTQLSEYNNNAYGLNYKIVRR